MKKFLKAAGIILIVMLIPLLTTNVTDAEESTTTLYLRAVQHEQKGEYDQAMALFKRILTKEDSPTVTMKMYEIEIKRNNRKAADEIITNAYTLYPDHPQVAFYYGFLLTDRAEQHEQGSEDYVKYYNEAAVAFQNALKAEPTEQNYVAVAVAAHEAGNYPLAEATYRKLIQDLDRPDYYRSLAAVKLEQGRRDEAVGDMEKAIELSDDVQAHLMLAAIYLQEDNPEKAMDYLGRVSELRPDLSAPNLYLGEYYQKGNNYEQAVHYYLQAAATAADPSMKVSILKIVGGMALEKEDYIVAYEAFSKAIDVTPQDQQLYYYAGFSADMLDDLEIARAIYEKGLERFPEYTMLRKRLAINYISAGEADKALAAVVPIDDIERDVQYYLILSNAYEAKNDLNQAIAALQDGIGAHTYNTRLFLSLAFLYEKTKRYDDCINVLKEALKYEPQSAPVKNFLGYLYADLNRNLDEAYTLISEALKQEPDNYAYIDSMAWVYFRKGEHKKAHELLKEALAINPKDPELLDHMQQVEKALKK